MNWDLLHFIPGNTIIYSTPTINQSFIVKTLLIYAPAPLFCRSEEVVAVASMNYDPIVSRVAEVLGSGKTIKKRDVE